MAYYLNLFSPETYESFQKSDMTVSGFRPRQRGAAERVKQGDKLICYMTKLSRFIGVLEVEDECFQDDTPIFFPENDPYIVRFKVKPLVWLEKDKTLPIHEDQVWNHLSFTSGQDKKSSTWTGKVRNSLNPLPDSDGEFLESQLFAQKDDGQEYKVDEREYRKLVSHRVRRADKFVSVTVPEDISEEESPAAPTSLRDSLRVQAQLADIGAKMGFSVWLPRNDRNAVLTEWNDSQGSLIDILPLNYDDTTLKTIENIDVLWLKGRAIVRTFEVEHTTSVYSGILRMADLLALQPNMDINLHIVAPANRRDKVFQELKRPVFSLLDRGPLSEM